MSLSVPNAKLRLFTGNVQVKETVYAPSQSALAAIQDAAEVEFPNVVTPPERPSDAEATKGG